MITFTFTEQQISKIQELNPLEDSRFNYNPNNWKKLSVDYLNIIRDFENTEISRQDVINTFNEYFLNNKNGFMKPFLLTMVWGYANFSSGAKRTNNILSKVENIKKIKIAIDLIYERKNDYCKKAFKQLKSIDGLGVSFLSKILYFATRSVGIKKYALIFDNRVASALIKLYTPAEIYSLVTVQRSDKFEAYCKYLDLMHKTSQRINVDADKLEMFLFQQQLS